MGAGLPAIQAPRSVSKTRSMLSQASQLPHKPAPTQASSHTSQLPHSPDHIGQPTPRTCRVNKNVF
ncbi:hypothetical protein FEM54_11190 [Pseudomonas edaphica]|uniref:Uncharacterized protein n=1 Tax=Pseudomonas edaphica TaxID=2006980 RepID=A0ABY2U8C6_9PSED|nr:hypothetical protein FEM54_11190 [Pseudomonas edaphica]